MTPFDYLKDIFVTKKGNLPLDNYIPFMINRWLSFINPAVAETINQFNNQTLLENKEMHYKTMLTLFPKMSYAPRIDYIKKAQEEIEENKEENKRIELLAAKYELSKKEIISLLAFKEALDLPQKTI